jgi:hypothetical protein
MNNTELNYETVPTCYKHCNISECPLADNCLRFKAYQILPKSAPTVMIVNPKSLEGISGQCPHYRPFKLVKVALGFKCLKDQMSANQYARFKKMAIGRSSKTTFYRCLNGERIITPKDKKTFLSFIHSCNPEIEPDKAFDSFMEIPNW